MAYIFNQAVCLIALPVVSQLQQSSTPPHKRLQELACRCQHGMVTGLHNAKLAGSVPGHLSGPVQSPVVLACGRSQKTAPCATNVQTMKP